MDTSTAVCEDQAMGARQIVAGPLSFNDLLNEIIEQHIFKYFWFTYWVTRFTVVCKQWKRIVETAKIAEKHLAFKEDSNVHALGTQILMVQKYQPNILTPEFCRCGRFALKNLVEASKRLDTLIVQATDIKKDKCYGPLPQIKTLAVSFYGYKTVSIENLVLKLFPNVTRLQLDGNLEINITDFHVAKQLEELVLLTGRNQNSRTVKVFVRGEQIPVEDNALSYERYFRYFGETELAAAFRNENYKKMAQVLQSGKTSLEYESDLFYQRSYIFPTKLLIESRDVFYDDDRLEDRLKNDLRTFHYLVEPKVLQASDESIFICLCRKGNYQEALEILPRLNYSLELEQCLLLILRNDKIIEYIRQRPDLCEAVRKRIKKDKTMANNVDSAASFKKIVDLRDWSKIEAKVTGDMDLFIAMATYKCSIPYEKISEMLSYEYYVDALVKLDKSHLFLALTSDYFPYTISKHLMTKYDVGAKWEHEGICLLNSWIKTDSSYLSEQIKDNLHLINHIDSSGLTPLISAIESNTSFAVVERMLSHGADPNLHRGDRMTPLGTAIHKLNSKEMHYTYNWINLLLEYGADLNAPCLYKKRMCSPLMIAVTELCDNDFLLFLIAKGARVDYEDETGTSIIECTLHYSTAKLLRSHLPKEPSY